MTAITIATADPLDPQARACLSAYYAVLNDRFPEGFDVAAAPDPDPGAMRPPRGTFLLAWRGDAAVGCVALSGAGSGTAEVKRLYVSPEARGQGLATRLMAEIEAAARTLGYTRLQLDTNRVLHEAIGFYRRHGWADIARYNDNPYAHHWFGKSLAGPA